MKIIAFILLFGLAAASLDEKLDETVDEYILDVLNDMKEEPSIEHHVVYNDHSDQKVNDLTKLRLKFGKQLKETLNKIFEKIKTAVEEGKFLEKGVIDKLTEVYEHLKEKKNEVSEEIKELWQKISEKVKEYVRDRLEKISQTKNDVHEQFNDALAEINIREVLLQIKEHIKNNVDPEFLKAKLEKVFAQGSELLRHFLELMREKAKNKMLILIDGLLDGEERAPRGIKDYWEKVKNYFKDLKIDLQEKYLKFGEWVKENFNKGMEASKDKMENIRAIAREFAKHAKGISKDVANEAGEFFRQYKEDLGNVWEEIKERIEEIRNRKD